MNTFKNLKLFPKLYLIFAFFLIIFFSLSVFLISNVIETTYLTKNTEILKKHINFLEKQSALTSQQLKDYSDNFGIRITLIKPDGTVFYDSHQDSLKMENHRNRPEVIAALQQKQGVAIHYSVTLHERMLYAAKLADNKIIRVSVPFDNIQSLITKNIFQLIFIYFLAALIILILVFRLTRNITFPLKQLTDSLEKFAAEQKLEHLQIKGKNEIEVLTASFNDLISQISSNLEQLKKLENVRKEFIANVSHELRTPLTTVTGFLDTLDAGAMDDPQYNKRFLGIIKDNIQRLTALVDDILNLSKIENQKAKKERLNLSTILLQLVNDQDLGKYKNVKIEIKHKRIFVMANEGELYSAMQNYIDNALKYCPGKEIIITLQKENDLGLFSVEDKGPGIEPDHLPRLFERFYRPDKNRSRETGGTGLGLSIVKNIVEKYGGKVGVQSQFGKGSRFYFYLPLEQS